MTLTDLPQHRLLNQRIAQETRCSSPEEVVRWLGAVQAQDYGQAAWALGQRLRTPSQAAVAQAIADGNILLTWALRGTLHLVPAPDAGWLLQLLAPRQAAAATARRQQLGLDEATHTRARNLVVRALQGGRAQTRAQLMQLFEQAGIGTTGQRGYHLLWSFGQEGLLCLGPLAGKQQTFVLLEEWVPTPTVLGREEGLATLALRYFTSHGPATAHDFAWWSGLAVGQARRGLESIKARLVTRKLEGKEYWWAENSPSTTARPLPSTVHLLPGFDEYLLGYQDRQAVLAAEHADLVVPGRNGIFQPMVVVDGRIVGTWKRTFRKNDVEVFVKLFESQALSPVAAGQLARAIEQYQAFAR